LHLESIRAGQWRYQYDKPTTTPTQERKYQQCDPKSCFDPDWRLVGSGDWDLVGHTFAGDSLPEGPEIVPPPSPSGVPYAVANFYVNIRSEPGAEYPAFCVAASGSSAEIIGVSPDRKWWMVRLPTTISPDGTGWVSAEYVTAYNTDQVPVPELYIEP